MRVLLWQEVFIGGVDGPAGVANAGPHFAAERNAAPLTVCGSGL